MDEKGVLILILRRAVHQLRRQHEWIVWESKQLFPFHGSWYCTDHNQRYRLRFGITWKLTRLFGHCYKFPLTPSLLLPFIQLGDRWSNRHFDMRASPFGSHQLDGILTRVRSERARCVLNFIPSFMYHLCLAHGRNQSWSFRCRCVSTASQKIHRGMWA